MEKCVEGGARALLCRCGSNGAAEMLNPSPDSASSSANVGDAMEKHTPGREEGCSGGEMQ